MDFKKGERPVIGRQYQPATFEHRESDGAYESFMPRLGLHEARIQAAYMASSSDTDFSEWLTQSWLPKALFLIVCWAIVCFGLMYLILSGALK